MDFLKFQHASEEKTVKILLGELKPSNKGQDRRKASKLTKIYKYKHQVRIWKRIKKNRYRLGPSRSSKIFIIMMAQCTVGLSQTNLTIFVSETII